MKNLILFFLLTILFISCTDKVVDSNQQIRYFSSIITDLNSDYVSLKLGPTVRLDKHIISVNLSTLFLVLEETKPMGFAYINDEKVGATLIYTSGKTFNPQDLHNKQKSVRLADNSNLILYDVGTLLFIKDFSKESGILTLSNGSTWKLENDEVISELLDWETQRDIIVPSGKSNLLILPYKAKGITAKPINQVAIN